MTTKDFLISKGIKNTSAYVYGLYYDKLIKECFNNKIPEAGIDDEKVNQQILDFIKSDKFTIMTKINYIKSFIKLDDVKKENRDIKMLSKELKRLNTQSQYSSPSKKEVDAKITISEVIKKREIYKNKCKNVFGINDVYYLALSFYTYLPPLRSQDYINTMYKDETTDIHKDNYYDSDKKQLIYNTYKTIESNGKRIINVPDELAEIIDNFHKKSESKYIICSSKKGHLSSIHFNKILKVSAGGSCNMLRKIYISEKIDNGMSVNERKDTAVIMGHSLAVQQLTYSRFSDSLHQNDNDMNYLVRMNKKLTEQLEENTRKILKLMLKT
jgi:integrase